MNLSTQQLISVIKKSLVSGTFGVFSFICFFLTYNILEPRLEIFMRFFDSNNLLMWVHHYLSDLESIVSTLCVLASSAIVATMGLFNAIFAKSFHDKAVEALKSEIGITSQIKQD